MGKARFLYNNLITDESMISVSSLRSGLVTGALKEGAGSAVIATSGTFSGTLDLEYIVEIDSIAGGAEVGQATFRWSDGSGAWNASGVTTPSTPTELNNGVKIAFTSGSGADFAVGDRWYFKGVNLFNAGKMIDMDRDHRYRSAALESPNTVTINLGSAQTFDSLIIFDHNMTNAATIVFEADEAATFDSNGGSPDVSESVTWVSEKILHYLASSKTKQYARLKITDAANPDGYIEIGELFLGVYLELTKNYIEGYSQEPEFLMDNNTTSYGVSRDRFYNEQITFEYDFDYIESADIASLDALKTAICSRSTGQFKRFWFNADSTVPADCWMVKLLSMPKKHRMRSYYDMPMLMQEVVRSV